MANFVFAASSRFHPDGFGYLIPRPRAGYGTAENPGILGTVFDSCSLAAQDTPCTPPIKVTMMLGGPYGRADIAESTLLRHLGSHLGGVRLPEVLYSRVQHHRECIPTFAPGHLERMGELRRVLGEGRLEVIGAGDLEGSVTGIARSQTISERENIFVTVGRICRACDQLRGLYK